MSPALRNPLSWPRLPLSLRVPLLAAALMILVGLVASQIVLSAVARLQDDRLRELARLHVDGLMVALGPAVQRRDVWEVWDVLDRAAGAPDDGRLALTVVADDRGRVLAATDPRAAPVDAEFARLTPEAQALDAVTMPAGVQVIRVLSPLFYQGREVGQVLAEIDVADLAAERARLLRLLLLGNAVATGLLALGGYWAVRRMLRPIRLLARHMESAEGRPVPFAAAPRDAETIRFVQTYDAMAEAVAARAEAERRLAERERYVSLGRLSSSLAHEINNPLGGLLNAVDTVRTYADRPDVVREGAALLDRGLRHLRDVARAILDEHRRPPEAGPLGPSDFADLRTLIAPEVERRSQSLDWRVAAGPLTMARLPAAPVRQVALNLLLNAAEAAGPGGHLALDLDEAPGELRLLVADSGQGLSGPALRRLLHGSETDSDGGMGLRTIHDLVAGLGGWIDHARRGGRTEIVVRVPVGAAA